MPRREQEEVLLLFPQYRQQVVPPVKKKPPEPEPELEVVSKTVTESKPTLVKPIIPTPAYGEFDRYLRKPTPTPWEQPKAMLEEQEGYRKVITPPDTGRLIPAAMRAEEKTIRKQYKDAMKKEEQRAREDFNRQISEERRKAIDLGYSRVQLDAWEGTQRKVFQRSIDKWKKDSELKYQGEIKAWRDAWRPRSLAETIASLWQTEEEYPHFKAKGLTGELEITYEPVRPFAGLAGVIAPFEGIISTGLLITGARVSVPPTVSGALTTQTAGEIAKALGFTEQGEALIETGKAEYERMEEEYGKGYMKGTVLGDILLTLVLGEAWKRIRGGQVKTIRGVKEVEYTVSKPGKMYSERVSNLLTETQRISYKEWEALKEFERYFKPENIYLAGTTHYKAGEAPQFLLGARSIESWRPAESFVRAAKGKLGFDLRLRGFPDVYKYTLFQSTAPRPKPTFTQRVFSALGLLPARKDVVVSIAKLESPLLTGLGERVSTRVFTGIQVSGRIDPSIYLRFLKAISPEVGQKWLTQMGGVTIQQIRQTPRAIEVTTKIIGVTAPRGLGWTTAPLIVAPKLTPKVKKIPTPKAGWTGFKVAELPKQKERSELRPKRVPIQTTEFKIPPIQKTIHQKYPPFTIPTYRPPTVTYKPPTTAFPRRPRGGAGWPKDLRDLWGEWFLRKHPIPTPEMVVKQVYGEKVTSKLEAFVYGRKKGKRKRKTLAKSIRRLIRN